MENYEKKSYEKSKTNYKNSKKNLSLIYSRLNRDLRFGYHNSPTPKKYTIP